jgi:hypothetical protein
MLLDKYVLTKGLTTLLSHFHTASSSTTAQANFVKRVNQIMTRPDPLLKTLQVRPFPPEGLVQAYLIQIKDRSDTNFRKILDLKGIRKAEQPTLVELFGIHRDGKSNEDLVDKSPLMTPLITTGGLGSGGLGIGAAALGAGGINVQQRFDPTGFGEKLFSAARDGVGAAGERMGSPLSEDAKGAVEGNLKSIGKFFRRDMSGFGRFGARRDGSGSVDETIR